MSNVDIARAFSGHRFEEAFGHLSPDVTWHLVGETTMHGRDAVMAACRGTADENADTTTSWLRFVSAGTGDVVAVDAIARYEGPEGTSTVSSCDIYEFDGDVVRAITTYAVLLTPDAAGAPAELAEPSAG